MRFVDVTLDDSSLSCTFRSFGAEDAEDAQRAWKGSMRAEGAQFFFPRVHRASSASSAPKLPSYTL